MIDLRTSKNKKRMKSLNYAKTSDKKMAEALINNTVIYDFFFTLVKKLARDECKCLPQFGIRYTLHKQIYGWP